MIRDRDPNFKHIKIADDVEVDYRIGHPNPIVSIYTETCEGGLATVLLTVAETEELICALQGVLKDVAAMEEET